MLFYRSHGCMLLTPPIWSQSFRLCPQKQIIAFVKSSALLAYKPTLLYTCLESAPHSHTLRAACCRHNVVVCCVSSEPLREVDDRYLTLGGGGVTVDQVGVRCVCTILNGAGVPWLEKCTLYKCTCCVGCVEVNHKVNIPTTYTER